MARSASTRVIGSASRHWRSSARVASSLAISSGVGGVVRRPPDGAAPRAGPAGAPSGRGGGGFSDRAAEGAARRHGADAGELAAAGRIARRAEVGLEERLLELELTEPEVHHRLGDVLGVVADLAEAVVRSRRSGRRRCGRWTGCGCRARPPRPGVRATPDPARRPAPGCRIAVGCRSQSPRVQLSASPPTPPVRRRFRRAYPAGRRRSTIFGLSPPDRRDDPPAKRFADGYRRAACWRAIESRSDGR